MLDLAFLNPWILSALATLPVIYLLLKVLPPAPKIIAIPTFRFLQKLESQSSITSTTPWWLLLLRLLIAALLIITLAGPVYKPAPQLQGSAPLRLIIDNSWASTTNWQTIQSAAERTIKSAAHNRESFTIYPTAPSLGQKSLSQTEPMNASSALAAIKGLRPQPWPADYKTLTKLIEGQEMQTIWFNHGLIEPGISKLIDTLRDQGDLTIYTPNAEHLPLALQSAPTSGQDTSIKILADKNIHRTLTLQTIAEDGSPLDQQTVKIKDSVTTVTFDKQQGTQSSHIQILNQTSAAATLYIDENTRRRHVGILAPTESSEDKPFIEASYYLKRALAPYASITLGSINTILEQDPSLIILPDIAAMPPETLESLDEWVKQGGILLRYSGPSTVKNANHLFLSPVALRAGGRAMDGAITWNEPTKLTSFPETSPLYGINIHEPITIKRQILAEPSEDLSSKTWASLEDGTPLITAAPHEDGLLILIHTTATPAWSDFAISGAYVETLRRILALSSQPLSTAIQTSNEGSMTAEWIMDAQGQKQKPSQAIPPIPVQEIEKATISPLIPPGLYSRPGMQHIFNLGDALTSLRANTSLIKPTEHKAYNSDISLNLTAPLWILICILFALDWLIIHILTSPNLHLKRLKSLTLALLLLPFLSTTLQAQTPEDIEYSTNLYLAYVQTGNTILDNTSQQGLKNLSQALASRTSVVPKGVVGLKLEDDELTFFPLIYWPITTAQKPLSTKALEKLQHYIDHGGTILIDKKQRAAERNNPDKDRAIQKLIGSLNILPMHPAPKDHVLRRSFYLLDQFPGLYNGDHLWVERKGTKSHDGVSSIIIGSHDWSGAWALAPYGSSPTRQYELALRFGINTVMYALTGNYKADQVHLPAILERVGQ